MIGPPTFQEGGPPTVATQNAPCARAWLGVAQITNKKAPTPGHQRKTLHRRRQRSERSRKKADEKQNIAARKQAEEERKSNAIGNMPHDNTETKETHRIHATIQTTEGSHEERLTRRITPTTSRSRGKRTAPDTEYQNSRT